MRIEGRYQFAAPPERVWDALQDPRTLAAALPGVRRLEVVGPDRYAISLMNLSGTSILLCAASRSASARSRSLVPQRR